MSDCRFGVSPVNYPDPDPAPSEDSDQPRHLPGLIRVFAVYSENPLLLHVDNEDSDQTGRTPRLI